MRGRPQSQRLGWRNSSAPEKARCCTRALLTQTWFQNTAINAATGLITIGAVCRNHRDPVVQGESAPMPEELTRPGSMTPERFLTIPSAAKSIDESYTDGDVRDPSHTSG